MSCQTNEVDICECRCCRVWPFQKINAEDQFAVSRAAFAQIVHVPRTAGMQLEKIALLTVLDFHPNSAPALLCKVGSEVVHFVVCLLVHWEPNCEQVFLFSFSRHEMYPRWFWLEKYEKIITTMGRSNFEVLIFRSRRRTTCARLGPRCGR